MNDSARMTIAQVRSEARGGALDVRIHAQIEDTIRKEDRNGKPFWEIKLRDGTDALGLKAWNNSPNFDLCETLEKSALVEVGGEFSVGAYGLEAQRWTLRFLDDKEAAELFAGDEEARALNQADFDGIGAAIATMTEPRLKALAGLYLKEFGDRFRRAAAARFNHHAYRGGLLRHTAQMMKSAEAICSAYPALHRDLLLSGVLFHDCGKLWEMCPRETGFEITREVRGELLGHISIGIEAVNALWRRLPLEEWRNLQPRSEDVRTHLLHLIAAHHGELEFGSPVQPKTPEAIALHYIDNMDARLEMIFAAYERQLEIAAGIFERVRALNVAPVRALTRLNDERPPAA